MVNRRWEKLLKEDRQNCKELYKLFKVFLRTDEMSNETEDMRKIEDGNQSM